VSPSGGGRAERLAARLGERGIDSLLVTSLVNVEYLTGFTGTNAACLVSGEQRVFFTDFRYAERAAELSGDWTVEVISGDWLEGLGASLSGRVGIEDDRITVRTAHRLREALPAGCELADAGGEVEALRRIKDDAEIAAIARAAALTDEIYLEVFERGLVGRTEADIAAFVQARMREHGAEPSFPPIVAAGPNGALPHAEPGPRVIGTDELVVLDMGAKLDGYCSDCTRTVATGEVDARAAEIYGVVLAANELALDAVSAGARAAELDAVARNLIDEAGYGELFGHGLGHGVGLEVHEAPRLGRRSDDVLVERDVVTVEPGIYLAGICGVRIEDLVVVGAGGVELNLSGLPKTLSIVS
jgi:Xaa-Pro aminopeptidase